jgi:hypothetical protein
LSAGSSRYAERQRQPQGAINERSCAARVGATRRVESTTDREQIELNSLVQSLSAEGYQVDPRGPQWVVYTEIADRRSQESENRCKTVEPRRR